jgi:hypothetical protein
MSSLSDRYSAERTAFGRLKKLCESKVVRWEYWDRPVWHWDPYYFLEARQKPKRVTKDKAWFGYGYDKENRVAVIHQFSIGKPGNLHAMEFLRYSGNKIAGSDFIAEALYEGNKVVGSDFQAGGVLADVFEATLSGGRIVRVEHLIGGLRHGIGRRLNGKEIRSPRSWRGGADARPIAR